MAPEEWDRENFELGGRDLLIFFDSCLWRADPGSDATAILKRTNISTSLDDLFKRGLFELMLHRTLDGDAMAFDSIIGALDDPDLEMVQKAMDVLRIGRLHRNAESALPRLIDILPTLPGSIQKEMYSLFGLMTNRIDLVAPVLIGGLGRDSRYWREASSSLVALSDYQRSVATAVAAAFREHQGPILGFVNCLAELGPPAKDALPRLRESLESERWDQRYACAMAIWKIGNQPDALARLRFEELFSEDEQMIWNGLVFFGRAESMTGKVVPRVAELLAHPEERLRGRAAVTLGKIGAQAISAIPALEAAAQNDSYLNVREAAEQALKEIRSSAKEILDSTAEAGGLRNHS